MIRPYYLKVMKGHFPLVALLLFLTACAPSLRFHHQVDEMIAAGDYQNAYLLIEENKKNYTKRNAVLFYADKGTLAHYAGMYRESIESLVLAENRVEELFTTSVSKQVATFIINDNMAPYKGEDFEGVMLNLFLALNYLQTGEIDEALVEARKVDSKLNLINSYHPAGKKNIYKEDAFVRFLMGILYEVGGTQEDLNDAFISYKKAEESYVKDYWANYKTPLPRSLKENLLTTAYVMGTTEVNTYKNKYSCSEELTLSDKQQKGELYFIHYNGKSPEKIEDAIVAPMPDGYILKIAFPRYHLRPYNIRSSVIKATNLDSGNTTTAKTELGENIAAIAVKNLENRKVRIGVKAIARATAKYLAIKEAKKAAQKEYGDLAGNFAGLLGNIAAIITERADLRCWKTLPAEIRIGRSIVDPGNYKLDVSLLNKTGGVIRQLPLDEISIKRGEKKFIFFRTID
jgi:hypothetical protein